MKHPTKEECQRLLVFYGTPVHVQKHCRAVANVAYTTAKELNKHGFNFNLDLIMAAGLLHDIARLEEKHWEAGAKIAEKHGYKEEADIIKVHMTYSPFSPLKSATETDLVCLGDRTVKEDEYVGLDERIDYIIDKAVRNGRPEAKTVILEKKKETKGFIDEIEEVIGMSLDELMGSVTNEDR